MVLIDAIRLVIFGLASGVAVAVASSGVMSRLLFGVAPTDWPTYAAVCALFLLAAATAAMLPARRATSIEPMIALRAI
jgi:ABC-type antimicrobial peptide transport system permease subunit